MPRPNPHTRDLVEAVQELLDHARETGQTATHIVVGGGILASKYHEGFTLMGMPVEVREGLAPGRVILSAGANTVGGRYAGPFDPQRDMLPSSPTAADAVAYATGHHTARGLADVVFKSARVGSAVVCPKGTVENLGPHDGMGFPNTEGNYYLMRMYEDVGAGETGQDVLMLCPKHQVDK